MIAAAVVATATAHPYIVGIFAAVGCLSVLASGLTIFVALTFSASTKESERWGEWP